MVETLATGRELSHTFSCETVFGDDGLVGMLETIGKTKVLGGIFPLSKFSLGRLFRQSYKKIETVHDRSE
jgi:hypothetical protein